MDRYDGLPDLRSSWTPQEISDALRPHIERLGFEDEHWPEGQSNEDHIVTAWHRISDVYSPYKVPKEGIAFTAADGSSVPIEGDTSISGMDGVSVWSHGDVNVGVADLHARFQWRSTLLFPEEFAAAIADFIRRIDAAVPPGEQQ